MSLRRRAGAPRLIEWTGERCVPWTPDVQVAYEHLHRYLWAAGIVAGRRVLDLGSGEGFGASILADESAEVVGLDIDRRTVEHAQLNWSGPKTSFVEGSALDLSMFDDGSFGAVVAFEVIEHLEEQERVLSEAARVLAEDGLLIISTPDRRIYSESSGQQNPFHERELSSEEFRQLLERFFPHIATWGQRTITGSHLGALDGMVGATSSPSGDFFIERAGEEWRVAAQPTGLYLVAIASRHELPSTAANSTLGDCGLELLRVNERVEIEAAVALVSEHDANRAREQAQRERSEAELRERDATVSRRDVELRERDEYVRHRREETAAVRAQLGASKQTAADLVAQLEDARQMTQRVEESVTWQLFQRIRGRVFSSVGESSFSVRALSLMLRVGGRLMSRQAPPEASTDERSPEEHQGEVIRFPHFKRPTVSLVVPLYARADLTRRCLESIRDNTDKVSYEVILIDDTADAETKSLLNFVHGARIITNEQNRGYLLSMNEGARAASGRWLVLCNNDIEVTPSWLESMLLCAESGDSIGVVAPKFVGPDGRLSEAGGILWNDGTGVNFGRGDDPNLFQYEYTREVDYGSAAALLVRAELWREIGGFDERYVPMYYEDSDLCLQARARGWRVLYEPSAVVVHFEGATAGTDPQAGHKRYQEINRLKFVEKWQEVLDAEHLRPNAQLIRQAAVRHRGPRVLVVDFRVPMWDRDSGSLRMFEIICSLLRLGYSVTLLPDNMSPVQPYARNLQRLGVELIYGPVDLAREFAEIGPTLTAAILSRPHSASRWLDSLRDVAPFATMVYDTVDLHWVRESRRFALSQPDTLVPHEPGAAQGPKAAALLELELAMVRATDVTITVTKDEEEQVLALVPDARTTIISNVHEVSGRVAPAKQRSGLLFVGGFEHPPNVDAVSFLVQEVMPLVWARVGEVSLTVVGPSAPAEIEGLASAQVDIRGWVGDLEPLLSSARALVVPVRFGAGVKGKITQGLAAGLPVVTTSVGSEGLADGEAVLIADSAVELADRIVEVIEDDSLWQSLSRAGQELVAANCSREVLDERLQDLLSTGRADRLVGST